MSNPFNNSSSTCTLAKDSNHPYSKITVTTPPANLPQPSCNLIPHNPSQNFCKPLHRWMIEQPSHRLRNLHRIPPQEGTPLSRRSPSQILPQTTRPVFDNPKPAALWVKVAHDLFPSSLAAETRSATKPPRAVRKRQP